MLTRLISHLRQAIAILLLVSATQAAANNIGSVTENRGVGEVVRNSNRTTVVPRLPIRQMDTVRTGNGRVKITFVDNTTVNVTEQSRLVIDDFVYSGQPSTSRMSLRFASGTVRFATGNGIQKSNINLRTPSATIAVRGTDFTSTVDELGRSLVILLPEEDGSVGEITVENAAGSVILNQAFQATMVQTFESRPSQPVILNLSLGMIDNMLIVTPPEEVENQQDYADSKANILDLSELDVDYLQYKDLDNDDLAMDALSRDALAANFLEDYLSDIGELSGEKDGVSIKGTSFGYNETTQIYAIIMGENLNIFRSVGSTVSINTRVDEGKNILINQNNIIHDLEVNGGGSQIFIQQSN